MLAKIALLRLMVGAKMLMGGMPGLATIEAWFPGAEKSELSQTILNFRLE